MPTIGILTHCSINYGAVLQAYALQQILRELNYVSEIIDYRNLSRSKVDFSIPRRFIRTLWHGAVKSILVGNKRLSRTKLFREKHLHLSSASYLDSHTLHSNPPSYDIYLVGSDQVWNPKTIFQDTSYLLTFVPDGKTRVSYAASFGVPQLSERFINIYKEPLRKIKYLSVRELEGKDIIQKLIDREVEVTLDPTLLLDRIQWNNVSVPFNNSRPYILCYYMPDDKEVTKNITKIARDISTVTGWEVICIGQREYMRLHPGFNSVFNAGPAEFVGMFQSASFVVTNSFHGTAFSIIYKKPFFVPVNSNLPPEKALSSRITSLLRILKLDDRVLVTGKNIPNGNSLEIDYYVAERLLQQERRKSIAFLENALK